MGVPQGRGLLRFRSHWQQNQEKPIPDKNCARTKTALTATTFEETVTANDIVLVDFWADWCGPCKRFAPVFEAASDKHPDVVFAKVDTEAEQGLSAAADIRSIPTLMAFRQGILVFNQAGALPADALEQLIAGVRSIDMDAVREQLAEQKAQSA
jgi:thioredoxin 1